MAARRGVLKRAIVVTIALGASAAPACAQTIGEESLGYLGTFAYKDSQTSWDQVKEFGAETVIDHGREGFLPNGLLLPGGHVLYPSLQASSVYDDNIFQDPVKTGDLRSTLTGQVELESNLPQNMFKLTANGQIVDFKNHPNLNFNDGLIQAQWRVELDAADSVGGSFKTQLAHDDNFLPIAPANAAAAVPIWTNRAAVGYMHDIGRTSLAIGADYTRTLVYDVPTYGGTIADESASDNDLAGAFAMLTYHWSPGYSTFVAARTERDVGLNAHAAYNNNDTFKGEAGFKYEFDPLLQFSFTGGYEYIKFDSPLQSNFGTTTFDANLKWLPTHRLTVQVDASQFIQRDVDGSDFGQLSDTLTGRVQYDIYHNILGTIDFELQQNQYIGTDRLDKTWQAGVSLDYLFNENLALTLSYQHTDRVSTDSDFTFNDNRYMARLKLSQ